MISTPLQSAINIRAWCVQNRIVFDFNMCLYVALFVAHRALITERPTFVGPLYPFLTVFTIIGWSHITW